MRNLFVGTELFLHIDSFSLGEGRVRVFFCWHGFNQKLKRGSVRPHVDTLVEKLTTRVLAVGTESKINVEQRYTDSRLCAAFGERPPRAASPLLLSRAPNPSPKYHDNEPKFRARIHFTSSSIKKKTHTGSPWPGPGCPRGLDVHGWMSTGAAKKSSRLHP